MIANFLVLAGVGILMISLVQVRIIMTHGFAHFSRSTMDDIYWDELSWWERLLFWGGLVMVLGAFVAPMFVLLRG